MFNQANIIYIEQDFYENLNCNNLLNLCISSYKSKDYYTTYFYSKLGIERTGIDIFYLYLSLSLFKLGYLNAAVNIIKQYEFEIEGLLTKDTTDLKDLLEFFILFEYALNKIPKNIHNYLESYNDEELYILKLLYKIKYFNDKNNLMLLKNKYESINDKFYKIYVSTVLGDLLNPEYYNNAVNNNFYTFNMFKNIEKPLDSTMLKCMEIDINESQGINYYNYCCEDYRFYSYPYEEGIVNMHLLEHKGKYLILDCGAYNLNSGTLKINSIEFLKSLNVDFKNIEGVLISHAHLDHYGSLNTLKSLNLKIFMTKNTYELLLKMKFDFEELNINIIDYNKVINLNSFKIIPFKNGHILGSCGFDIYFDNKRIVYMGDFCLNNQKTVTGLNLNELINKCSIDLLVIEGTYLRRKYCLEYEDNVMLFSKILKKLSKYNVKTLIPSFAIGRAQEIALILNDNDVLKNPAVIDGEACDITYYYQRQIGINVLNQMITISNKNLESTIQNYNTFIVSSGMLDINSTSFKYFNALKQNNMALIKVGYINKENIVLKEARLLENNILLLDIPLSGHASFNQLIQAMITLNPNNILVVHLPK